MVFKVETKSPASYPAGYDWAIGQNEAYKNALTAEKDTLNADLISEFRKYLGTIGVSEQKFSGFNPDYRSFFSDSDHDLCLEFDADVVADTMITAARNMEIGLTGNARQVIVNNCIASALGYGAGEGLAAIGFKHTPPHYWRGRYFQGKEKWQDALAEFQKAAARDPKETGAVFNAAYCLDKIRRKSDAALLYRRYLGMEQKSAEPDHGTIGAAFYNLSLIAGDKRQKADLLKKSAEAWEKNEDWQRAASSYRDFSKLVWNDNDDSALTASRKRLECLKKDSDSPKDELAWASLGLGQALSMREKFDEGYKLLMSALQMYVELENPEDYYIRYLINQIAVWLEDTKNRNDIYNQAISIVSKKPQWKYFLYELHMGMAFVEIGSDRPDTDAMEKYIEAAIAAAHVAPKDKKLLKVRAYLELAHHYAKGGAGKKAMENVRKAFAFADKWNTKEILFESEKTANELADHELFDEAIELNELQRELVHVFDLGDEEERYDDDSRSLDDFGIASMELAYRKGDYGLMERIYEKYEMEDPLRPGSDEETARMIGYGVALWNQGREEDAFAYIEKADDAFFMDFHYAQYPVVGEGNCTQLLPGGISYLEDAKTLMATVYERQGKMEKAHEIYDLRRSEVESYLNMLKGVKDFTVGAETQYELGRIPRLEEQLEFVEGRLKALSSRPAPKPPPAK